MVIADALTVSFLPLSSTRPNGNSRFFWFPTRLKILYCNPKLKKVLYKLLFALILKLFGTIRHTILKTWLAKPKNLELPWGLMLESGKKLTVRASATTTARKCAWYQWSLEKRGVPTDLGVIITSTIILCRYAAILRRTVGLICPITKLVYSCVTHQLIDAAVSMKLQILLFRKCILSNTSSNMNRTGSG